MRKGENAEHRNVFNPLPNDKILGWSNLKTSADVRDVPDRLTVWRVVKKFSTDRTVHNVNKGKSGRPEAVQNGATSMRSACLRDQFLRNQFELEKSPILVMWSYFSQYNLEMRNKQDVFVKLECPRNGHFLRNVTFIFDLDLCR